MAGTDLARTGGGGGVFGGGDFRAGYSDGTRHAAWQASACNCCGILVLAIVITLFGMSVCPERALAWEEHGGSL